METKGSEVHINATEASAGSKPGVVRYVLAAGLALVVIAFAIIVLTGTSTSNQDNNGTDDSARAAAQQDVRESQKQTP